ncbi:hypothetical protein BpHYR1_011525 [Brachionus plicatilis]|uniref:Uncharacterized protein n=1 Tax=Brachionus plicatilis TaxID=10195 RepID=A0A3M7QZF5_BRAPC|nr:hypothetical protein BpHYR1_011525 [Brachionus plicatilis]
MIDKFLNKDSFIGFKSLSHISCGGSVGLGNVLARCPIKLILSQYLAICPSIRASVLIYYFFIDDNFRFFLSYPIIIAFIVFNSSNQPSCLFLMNIWLSFFTINLK